MPPLKVIFVENMLLVGPHLQKNKLIIEDHHPISTFQTISKVCTHAFCNLPPYPAPRIWHSNFPPSQPSMDFCVVIWAAVGFQVRWEGDWTYPPVIKAGNGKWTIYRWFSYEKLLSRIFHCHVYQRVTSWCLWLKNGVMEPLLISGVKLSGGVLSNESMSSLTTTPNAAAGGACCEATRIETSSCNLPRCLWLLYHK